MKFGVPWSVKGIRPEARETAKEAARRSGLSLGDWLNTVILQQAGQAGLPGQPQAHAYGDANSRGEELASVHQRLDDITRRIEQFTRTGPAAYAPRRPRDDSQTAELIGRLDQRIDRLAQPAPPPLAPTMPESPPRPQVNLPPALDRAVAEIAARQRALKFAPAPAPAQRPPQRSVAAPPLQPAQPQPQPQPQPPPSVTTAPRAAVPTQDISGLEQQLRTITDQIETLRKPGVEEAIHALRDELGDIGRALNDAMPKRAIDSLEQQVASLAQRIELGRQAGVDANSLAGIEHGLAEVRDALHGLTPAEHLIGFTDAVANLAQKIDLIVAQRDPHTLQRLEDAITTLRGMASSVASNEAVGRLSAEVQDLAVKIEQIGRGPIGEVLNNLESRIDALSRSLSERSQAGDAAQPRVEALVQSLTDKIDQIQHFQQNPQIQPAAIDALAASHLDDRAGSLPVADVLNKLESRIDALSQALTERAQAGDTVPPRLEALVQSLADKIDQIQHFQQFPQVQPSATDSLAVSHLEDRIVSLVERLDASDSRFGHLEAIERGLADLLVHLQEIRADKLTAHADESPAVDLLKQDMARSQNALMQDLGRTQDALDAVHGTLGLVVDRLAMIEKDIRSERRAPTPAAPGIPNAESESPELSQPVGKLAVRLVDEPPAPMAANAAPTPAAAMPMAKAQAQPQFAPPPSPPPRLPAAAQLPVNPSRSDDLPLEPGSGPPQPRAHPSARIAASEAALGSARPAPPVNAGHSNFIAAARRAAKAAMQEHEAAAPRAAEPAEAETNDGLSLRAKMLKRVKALLVAASIVALVVGLAQVGGKVLFGRGSTTKTAHQVDTTPANEPPATKLAVTPQAPLAPGAADMLLAPATISGSPPRTSAPKVQHVPDLLNPPALYSASDITGSIPDAARGRHTAPPSGPVQAAEQLPVGIGGAPLRKAALAGDAGAAYEVAARFAEGRGVPANAHEAAHWYERAASKGLAAAQFRYASMLEKGQGVKKNLAQARRLYLAAAAQGNAKAMHNLAVLYAEGIDGKPDYATAVSWFQKAARHGIADSQYNLGILYARGIGVDKNLEESFKWFALAAAHGDKESAKKRDDIGSRLDAKELAAARRAVASFAAKPQPEIATAVPAPAGGWEKAAPAAKTQSNQDGPLSLGSFTVGKR